MCLDSSESIILTYATWTIEPFDADGLGFEDNQMMLRRYTYRRGLSIEVEAYHSKINTAEGDLRKVVVSANGSPRRAVISVASSRLLTYMREFLCDETSIC